MEFHELADLFPMINEPELKKLIEDVKTNGLLEPITTYENKILDGRNRFIACQMAFVEPVFVGYTGGDALQFVLSKNLQRRHLTSGQRAALAVDLLPIYERQAKERQSEYHGNQYDNLDLGKELPKSKSDTNKATQQAADATGTNRQYVSDAKTLQGEAPDLFEQVKTNDTTLPKAVKELKQRNRITEQEQKNTAAIEALKNKSIDLGVEVINADYIDYIDKIKDDSVDLVIVDPPYNVTGLEWDDIGTDREYLDFIKDWFGEIAPKLKNKYHMFVFFSPDYMSRAEAIINELDLPLKSRIIWSHRNLSKGRKVSDKFITMWEVCFHIGTHPLNFPVEWNDGRFEVQEFAAPQSNFDEGKHHQTSKPIELIKRLIIFGSKPGDYVLDTFAGGGTTGAACLEVGNRKCLLIEKEKRFCDVINGRLLEWQALNV